MHSTCALGNRFLVKMMVLDRVFLRCMLGAGGVGEEGMQWLSKIGWCLVGVEDRGQCITIEVIMEVMRVMVMMCQVNMVVVCWWSATGV